ncbi:MAG: LptF/LptG family permease [Thermodesulfovibrionales bacterium]
MIRIIYRSMLKELFITLLLIVAFLNSILMMEKILKLSRVLSGIGTTAGDMARLILYLQPQLLILTIPMSLLLAPIIVYGRMIMDNEIIILKASGMSFFRISRPVMLLTLIGFFSSIAISFYLAPKSSIMLKDEVSRIIAAKAALAIEAGTFNTSLKDLVVLVKGKNASDVLEDIFIYDNRSKDEPKVLMAKEGRFFMETDATLGLHLSHGYINIIKGNDIIELFFDRYRFSMNLYTTVPAFKKMELTPRELLERIQRTDDRKEQLSFYLEFHRRLLLPAVCLVLMFLAPPLALMSGKSGKLLGLALGLLVFTTYYVLQIYCENLAMNSVVPHYVGAWATTVLLSIFGMFLYRRESVR